MPDSVSDVSTPPTGRRWQFRLRSLLLLTAVIALALGWYVHTRSWYLRAEQTSQRLNESYRAILPHLMPKYPNVWLNVRGRAEGSGPIWHLYPDETFPRVGFGHGPSRTVKDTPRNVTVTCSYVATVDAGDVYLLNIQVANPESDDTYCHLYKGEPLTVYKDENLEVRLEPRPKQPAEPTPASGDR